jgi:hypothetical protein
MIKSDNINELAAALAKAQAKITSASKDSKAHAYKYADLATVIEAVKPALNENGLSFVQLIEESDPTTVKVTTLLLHSSGQFLGSTGSTGIPEMRGCNLAQAAGAAQSYLKRYQLQALTGLPTEDNDVSSEGFAKKAEAVKTTEAAPIAAAPVANGKSTNFSNRARQLRSTNGGEQSTPARNESF